MRKNQLKQVSRTSLFLLVSALIVTASLQGQGQRGGPGGQQGGLTAGGGSGRGATQPPPKALIANAKPVRSCESLASVALPNTRIESATIDPTNPGVCRVTAINTHPPAGDTVRIWIGLPTSNWNGRFLGTGGGGFS